MLMLFFGSHALAQKGDHTFSSEVVKTGSRIYVQQCAICHGMNGGWIADIDLSRGKFRTAVTDDDLRKVISQGAAEGRMPAFHLTENNLNGVIAYIRTGFDPEGSDVQIGDAVAGKELFGNKAKCSGCHRIKNRGPRTAPDLTEIGLIRTPGALHRSLVDPSNAVLPIHRPVTIVTKEKETVTGRRLNEDTYTVQVIDSKERLRTFVKADLLSYEISKTPTHKPSKLSTDEVADLIAYMLTLRGNP
jgi:putative heme-binding domain-containing protein